VSGQLHAPALLSAGQEPPIPTEYEDRWNPEPLWALWRRQKSFGPAGKIKFKRIWGISGMTINGIKETYSEINLPNALFPSQIAHGVPWN
jgi:hypothetical protein